MSAALSSRVSSGGGITKRSGGGRVRVDRDGDLDMDAPMGGRGGRGRGGNRGGRRGGGSRSVNINNAPRGPATDRERSSGSGSGATRSRGPSGRDPAGTRSRGGYGGGSSRRPPPAASAPVVGVRIFGWKDSKGSAEECARFLERKTNLKFRKTQKQGEYLILYVPPSNLQSVLDWDKAKFAGVNLKITADVVNEVFNSTVEDATPKNSSTVETIKILEEVLRTRYNPDARLLDLSKLGEDPLLQQNGFFELGSTTSKMFPALMSVADKKFDTPQQKRDAIQSVSLAGNSLKSIAPVTTLSITFPDLKNLSLEGNAIEDMKALDGWKSRFRLLQQLILVGNPVVNVPTYRDEMVRRYPKLIMLDNVVVERPQIGDQSKPRIGVVQRPSTAVDANGRPILPLPVKGNLLVDHNGLAMSFLSDFFAQIDNNKDGILAKFYTPDSKFSISVNTSAPRIGALQGERQYWDTYIPKSRNMKRIHDSMQMIDRLAQGPKEIRDLWGSLPATRHNLANQEIWSFDIFPVDVSPGAPGLLATVHSEFEEMNTVINSGSGGVIKRSFDRSFVLWMDAAGSVKVASDIMVVRSYAGATAWKVDQNAAVATPATQPSATPAVSASEVEEKRQKCQMLAEKTGLNLKFAEMCLVDTNWDLAAAWNAFMWAKENNQLGPEAYVK